MEHKSLLDTDIMSLSVFLHDIDENNDAIYKQKSIINVMLN